MTFTKLATAALVASLAAAPAYALNEGAVNQSDVGRVEAQVAQISDATLRAQAQFKVLEALGWLGDGQDYQAYVALKGALAIAGQPQVAEQPN